MPAPPILGNIARKVLADKVFLYAYAQNLRDTDGYVYAAGEVCIELCRIQNSTDENICTRIRLWVTAQRCDRNKQSVSNDELFEITPQDALKSEGYLLKIGLMLGVESFFQISKTRNRPLDEQRKERRKQRNTQYVLLRFDLFPIYVDDVAHGLEGVKRYAEGKHPVDRRDIGIKQRVYVIYEEVCVLERGEYAEVGNQCEHKYQLAALFALLFVCLALGPLKRLSRFR